MKRQYRHQSKDWGYFLFLAFVILMIVAMTIINVRIHFYKIPELEQEQNQKKYHLTP